MEAALHLSGGKYHAAFLKEDVVRPVLKRTSLDFAAFVWFIISLPWQQEDGGRKSAAEVA